MSEYTMNEYTLKDIEPGLEASFTKTMTVEMEDAFRQITGDDNPLHRDDGFAKEIGGGNQPGSRWTQSLTDIPVLLLNSRRNVSAEPNPQQSAM